METIERKFGLSGSALKYIAVFCMLLDHVATVLLEPYYMSFAQNGALFFTPDMPASVELSFTLARALHAVGRIAFPLFAFLCVEGFLHTRDVKKYLLRLVGFGVLAEIPYDLANHGVILEFGLQNVLFELAVGVATLWALSLCLERAKGWAPARRVVVCAGVILLGAGFAFLIRSEYVFMGVALMAAMYLLKDKPLWRSLACAPILLVLSPWALLALAPMYFYNGRRGKGFGGRYFFYVFYPAHLLLLYGMARLLL